MSHADLRPYTFARERFSHACKELDDGDRSLKERLLDAVVALSPLRPEDVPRSCQLLYEKMQRLIGPTLWTESATSGTLAAAVRSLPLRRTEAAARFIVMASETLDKYCGVRSVSANSDTDEAVAD